MFRRCTVYWLKYLFSELIVRAEGFGGLYCRYVNLLKLSYSLTIGKDPTTMLILAPGALPIYAADLCL